MYWIDPDVGGPLRPFTVTCDMTGGGWIRVDETTHYGFGIHTEGVYSQSYEYALSAAQINAIRAVSTEAKQSWACQTIGVGAAYPVIGFLGATTTFAACWDPANTAHRSSSGTHVTFADIPFREWRSSDCGDASEACQHNVGPAFFR
jgi:hypothetical protein